jgi:hypothetical protein
MQAWEKAYWFFANQDYSNNQCEFYANQFQQVVMEEMNGLNGNLTLDDLFRDFVADVVFSEKAEEDKERSKYV